MAIFLICMAGCNARISAETSETPLAVIPTEETTTEMVAPQETTADALTENTTYPPATVPTQGTTYPPATVPTVGTTYPPATIPSFTSSTTLATTTAAVVTEATTVWSPFQTYSTTSVQTTTVPVVTETATAWIPPQTETTTQTPVIPPVSGRIDFGGKTFTIVGANEDALWGQNMKEIYADEATDSISAAVRKRNQEIETLYNCKIKYVMSQDPGYLVSASVAVNRGEYDLFVNSLFAMWRNFECAYNLYSLDIDLDASYWNQTFIDTYTVDVYPKGKTLYAITGALSMEPTLTANVLFYNKDVFASKFPNVDLESVVADGEWTMDTFVNFVKEGGMDKNGNGYVEGEGDVIGFLRYGEIYTMANLFYGAGVPLVSNINDEMCFMHDVPSVSAAIDKAMEGYSAGYWMMANPDRYQAMMKNDEVLFLASTMKTLDDYRVEGNIGVLPYPKASQTQKNYGVLAERYLYAYSIPGDILDIQQAGNFLEIYASHSEETLMPAFYETYGARYGSLDMIQVIEESLVFDPAYQYWYRDIAESFFGRALKSQNTTQAFADKVAPRFQKYYAKYRQSIIDADK